MRQVICICSLSQHGCLLLMTKFTWWMRSFFRRFIKKSWWLFKFERKIYCL